MQPTGVDVLQTVLKRHSQQSSGESQQVFCAILERLWLSFERSSDLGLCAIFGDAIKDAAQIIAYEKDEWLYRDRYSEALFWHRYLRDDGRNALGVYGDLGALVLARHDDVSQALHLLSEIGELGRSYEYSCHWHMRYAG